MDAQLVGYTAGAIVTAAGYYLAGRFGRQLWDRKHRPQPQGRRR